MTTVIRETGKIRAENIRKGDRIKVTTTKTDGYTNPHGRWVEGYWTTTWETVVAVKTEGGKTHVAHTHPEKGTAVASYAHGSYGANNIVWERQRFA